MKKMFDLSSLNWTLAGYAPYAWLGFDDKNREPSAQVRPIPAKVPGSVQQSLLDRGIIKDWLFFKNSLEIEWIENRSWVYSVSLPDEWTKQGSEILLECLGLDYSGWIYLNKQEIGTFKGSHLTYTFPLGGRLKESGNELAIVFDLPPRWLGQFGYSSKMTEWKTRYNYTWDWVVRLVQIGISDKIRLSVSDGNRFGEASFTSDYDLEKNAGLLRLYGKIEGEKAESVRMSLSDGETVTAQKEFGREEYENGAVWEGLPVELWWTNLEGSQPLYTVRFELLGKNGELLDTEQKVTGFKHIEWRQCKDAPSGADPWLCVLNGKPVFLQGVNFQPIRANYADVSCEEYEKRIKLYAELGANMFRINACGYLEYECFYELCDKYGIMVWQEYPLTSSGLENWAPEDEASIEALKKIAATFISRRRHHASLCIWCAGNELQGTFDGQKTAGGKPCQADHPMLSALGAVTAKYDNVHRYLYNSPSGPSVGGIPEWYGKGMHYDVHGPYNGFATGEDLENYWRGDDSLFRSECCCPGNNPDDITEYYSNGHPVWPANRSNPLWCTPWSWWIVSDEFAAANGRPAENLEEFTNWSQERQAINLSYAAKACKDRFPGCGGFLLWGSHDTWPQPANTTIIDFWARPKPAALALKEVWRAPAKGE